MYEQAFEVLGIAPTNDGRAIRAAFVRLARIYHPDRFVGMPDDVRAEAERRMKDATTAYETLRDAGKSAQRDQPPLSDPELRERARRYEQAMRERDAQEARDRARWKRWEQLEHEAREKQRIDAEIEAMIRGTADPSSLHRARAAEPDEPEEPKPTAASLLAQRLDAARRGETAPLARRPKRTD